MYKPKIDVSINNKGYVISGNKESNIYSCSFTKFSNAIFDEIKTNPFQKLIFEDSCNITSFLFLKEFSGLEEVVISYSHKDVNITNFNFLKSLHKLGVPKFSGTLINSNLIKLGFVWSDSSVISEECKMLEEIDIHNCNKIDLFFEQVSKLRHLRKGLSKKFWTTLIILKTN